MHTHFIENIKKKSVMESLATNARQQIKTERANLIYSFRPLRPSCGVSTDGQKIALCVTSAERKRTQQQTMTFAHTEKGEQMSKRLIDAEDAKMRILNLWVRDKTLEDAVEDGYQYAIALVDAIDAVDDSPTVEGERK